jgi:hypothetical protein
MPHALPLAQDDEDDDYEDDEDPDEEDEDEGGPAWDRPDDPNDGGWQVRTAGARRSGPLLTSHTEAPTLAGVSSPALDARPPVETVLPTHTSRVRAVSSGRSRRPAAVGVVAYFRSPYRPRAASP